MAGEFAETTLGRLLSFANGRSSPERADGLPYPVYGSNGVIGRAAEANSDADSIVIGRVGSYCGSLYLSKQRCWVTDNAIRATALDDNDSRFLFYLLGTLRLNNWRAGSGQPLLNQDILSRIPTATPEPVEQRAIAHILGMLDDKIELNRRMNETLEAMARALFKSWFVDFDPVRAKAEGRDPGLPKALADLFADSLEDSAREPLPIGWRATTLGEQVRRCGGRIQTGPFGSQLHASDYVTEGVPVVMPKDLTQRRVSTESIARVGLSDAERLSRHRLQDGDIVYSRRGNVERHGLIRRRETGWLCGTGCLLVRLGRQWRSPLFASIALDQPETRAWIVQHAIGATMPNLNTGILAGVPLVVPTDDLLSAFDSVVQPLADRVIENDAQTQTIVSLRDALLPKLISGQLRLKNMKESIEEAT
jgi:type I restriction enzyme, S subunit